MQGIAIGEQTLSLARVKGTRGNFRLTRAASVDLPPGTLRGSILGPNISDPGAFGAALDRLFRDTPKRGPWLLSLPDSTVKMEVVRLRHIPPAPRDLEKVLLLNTLRGLPVDRNDLDIRFQVGSPVTEDRSLTPVFTVLMNKKVVAEYEGFFEKRGVRIGRILPETLAAFNSLKNTEKPPTGNSGHPTASVFIRTEASRLSLLAFRKGQPLIARSRSLSGNGRGVDSLIHHLRSTLVFLAERTPGGEAFTAVRLSGGLPEDPALDDPIQSFFEAPVERFASHLAVKPETGLDPAAVRLSSPAIAAALSEGR